MKRNAVARAAILRTVAELFVRARRNARLPSFTSANSGRYALARSQVPPDEERDDGCEGKGMRGERAQFFPKKNRLGEGKETSAKGGGRERDATHP